MFVGDFHKHSDNLSALDVTLNFLYAIIGILGSPV